MAERIFVQAKQETPSYLRTSPRTPATLPADLLEAASKRLSMAALLYAITYFIDYSNDRFFSGSPWGGTASPLVGDVTAVVSIGLSLIVFFVARSGRFETQFLLDMGLVYWAVGALGIEVGKFWWLPFGFELTGISWVCVWLVLFPLIVPTTPGKTLLAALVTASMGPLMYLIALVARGGPTPEGIYVLDLFLPYYLSAGLAFIGSRIIYQLGCDVGEARQMGSYRLIKLLGRGGIGEVWMAKHRLLARLAAVKLLSPEVLGATGEGGVNRVALRRFEREAQATAALRSPHTVELYDFGTTDDGSFYYAMELLDGFDLESLVTRFGPIPAERAIGFLIQACDSLAEAHGNGLIHRDIKPSNIYVCRLGIQHDFIKILDFGLVKDYSQDGTDQTQLTREGITTGTPAYMSPETALGQGEVDARSDIYSLGCVAYWLLTGQLVFEEKTSMKVILQHIQTPPVPPSERSELEIPEDLEKLVLSCLEKERDQRPQTALELSRQLVACQVAEPWTQERAEQWWTLHQPSQPSAG
ncbi:MAG: serine/threonine protein kinase [Acidobacteria bacterium]|nr:serine/threonine protein kinase [Acidobacteriota bacterium]